MTTIDENTPLSELRKRADALNERLKLLGLELLVSSGTYVICENGIVRANFSDNDAHDAVELMEHAAARVRESAKVCECWNSDKQESIMFDGEGNHKECRFCQGHPGVIFTPHSSAKETK